MWVFRQTHRLSETGCDTELRGEKQRLINCTSPFPDSTGCPALHRQAMTPVQQRTTLAPKVTALGTSKL